MRTNNVQSKKRTFNCKIYRIMSLRPKTEKGQLPTTTITTQTNKSWTDCIETRRREGVRHGDDYKDESNTLKVKAKTRPWKGTQLCQITSRLLVSVQHEFVDPGDTIAEINYICTHTQHLTWVSSPSNVHKKTKNER